MALEAGSMLPLLGAPDAYIGGPQAKSKATQVMQLEMTGQLLEDLLKSIRSGKPPQIFFGTNPKLRFGDNETCLLETTSEKFRHELYNTESEDDENGLHFQGLINHRLAIKEAEQASAGMDSALANLKSSLATLSQEKEARSTKIVDSPDLTPLAARRAAKGKKGLKTSNFLSGSRSISTSPAVAASSNPSSAPPTSVPTSQNQGSEIQKALRTPLLHLLAIKPLTLKDIAQRTRSKREDCAAILPKIARETAETREWKLTEKSYKELDVWKFPYPSDADRQSAIDNAIRAFDKQRLSPDEPIWQQLLPKHERGKGKSLSRLVINSSAAPPQRTTPLMGPKALGKKKAAAVKKTESKATEAKTKDPKTTAAAKGKKADAPEKSEEPVNEGPAKAKKTVRAAKTTDESPEKKTVARSTKMANSKKDATSPSVQQHPTSGSTPSSTSSKNPSKLRNTSNSADAPSKSASKSNKDKMKLPSTKPKTPSPLNSSVSASDFEDDHPVHRRLSASPSPRQKPRGVKRPSGHDEELGTPKKRKVTTTQASKSSNTAADAPKKRELASKDASLKTGDSKPLKRKADLGQSATAANTEPISKTRKMGVSSGHSTSRLSNANAPTAKRATHHSPSSSTDSSNSEPLRLSWRQTMRLAQNFREYYARYRDLYSALADADEPPSEAKRAELLKMHRKLEEMKRELARQGEKA